MIILGDRDKQILRHIEEWEFATIKQIADIFYPQQKYGYDLARKRLNLLVDNQKLLKYRDIDSNINVYTLEKAKNRRKSDFILMDFYAKLTLEGADILLFEKEYNKFMDGKMRPDAFIVIKIEGWLLYLFVEVQTRHAKVDLGKYERLFVSNEFQEKFQTNIFPTIVIIEDVVHKDQYKSDNFKVVQIDSDMSGFPKIFMPK